MDFNTKCYIVDSICGSGKTQSMLNYINNSGDDEHFLYITPYLSEIDRLQTYCAEKRFRAPKSREESGKNKLENLKKMIQDGYNIVSTHALFNRFDNEIIEICRSANYTLILDECAEVIETYTIGPRDFETLMTYTDVDENTKQLIWKDSNYNDLKFAEEKRLCELGSLVLYSDKTDVSNQNKSLLVWQLPIKIFAAFNKCFILTYLFDCQYQKYYYDYYGLKYDYLSVEGDKLDNYHFVKFDPNKSYIKYDYSKLINIIDNEKLNRIGSEDTPQRVNYLLSKSWYDKMSSSKVIMKTLKDNLYNFYMNCTTGGTKFNLWTCFKDYETALKGRGYSGSNVYPRRVLSYVNKLREKDDNKYKPDIELVREEDKKFDKEGNFIELNSICGFAPMNARATNSYRQTTNIAYPINRFMRTGVKNFFVMNGIEVDEDKWALSEMIQFLFRSALRNGQEINVYVPSIRMRNLLKKWIKDNPLENNL